MLYLNSWQKDLNQSQSMGLFVLFFCGFLFYAFMLFSRMLAQMDIDAASGYLRKAKNIGQDIIVEKSLYYQKALASLRHAMKLNPQDARLYFQYAEVVKEIEKDHALRGSVDRAEWSGGNDGESGFYDFAKAEYIEAIAREPVNAVYHQRLGQIYTKLQDSVKAECEFQKALTLDPHNISIHIFLSEYFLVKNRQKEFLAHLDKVVEIYKKELRGGYFATMAQDFFAAIGRKDLL